MGSEGDRGQMLLLAGVIVVLGLLVLNLNAAQRANVGQSTSRELERPIVASYQDLRRAFELSLQNELRDSAGVVRCPTDITDYKARVQSQLEEARMMEQNRGHALVWEELAITVPGGTSTKVDFRLLISDTEAFLSDKLSFTYTCT